MRVWFSLRVPVSRKTLKDKWIGFQIRFRSLKWTNMRKSKGVLLPPVRRSGRLRRGDLYRVLRNAVIEGVYTAGDRLPSTREAAADYGVSRGLMEEVFAQLTDEGFFERKVGRGTFISSQL